MSRPADWWVLDLPGDPTPGDPAQVRVLARSAGRMAEDAADAHRAVRGLAGDAAVLTWLGAAGEVFRGALEGFPPMLDKLRDSYEQAADALRWWASRLEDLQATADRALAQGRQARAEVEALSAQLASARGAVSTASAASSRLAQVPAGGLPPDPSQLRAATRNLETAQSRVSGLSGQLSSAQSRLQAARSMAEQARALRQGDARTTAGRLHDASDAGIAPASRWQKIKDAAAAAWRVTVKVATVVAIVVAVVALFVGGPIVWGILLAASAVLLADSLYRYGNGDAPLWEVGLNLLGVVPGGRLLTALGRVTGLAGAGARVAGAAGRTLAAAGNGLRSTAAAVRRGADDLVSRVRVRGLTGDTGSMTVGGRTAVRELDEARLVREFPRFADEGLPSRAARDFQTGSPYGGLDDWADRVAQPGDVFWVGEPFPGQFVVPDTEVASVGRSARRYYEGVQVGPKEFGGTPLYRDGGLGGYEVLKPLPVSESPALANRQFGDGGLQQVFLPDKIAALVREGYLRRIGHHPLPDDLVARWPASGRPR